MRDPGVQTGGPPGASSGTLAESRSRFANELANPRIRDMIAATIATEVDPSKPHEAAAVFESIINRAEMNNTTIERTLTPAFYGPMRTGAWQSKYRRLSQGERDAADQAIAAGLAGSNLTDYATDQGMFNEVRGPGKRRVGQEWFGPLGARGVQWANRRRAEEQAARARQPSFAQRARMARAEDRGDGRLVPDVGDIPKTVVDLRASLEKPIRMHIEAPEAPSRFVPRIRRASAANVQNRELHRERERSYADMEE
jgi:hypothetical protein